ncbi:ABC transporter permease [Paenibacillus wynnii]|uniref:ABC transporter permease n=1 Tax=Paenibacillus wynnii TaxID=268407 RepID=UPI00279357BF|nr:ABC transporter permease [Paenibacillus wynnii]MDQ0193723.1 putative ABC transport system permease protein [Paenibacillus wynnii]
MIGTNNRTTIRRLAVKSLKANSMRNLTIICAVILTTLLITSIFTMALSINKSMEQAQMRTVGSDFHGGFKYLNPSELEILRKHPSIREYGVSLLVGRMKNNVFADNPVEVLQVDKNYAKHGFIQFIEGGLPSGEDEIALNTWELDKLGVVHELGQRVTLEIDTGDKVLSREFVLSGYYEADKHLAMAGLAFVSEAFTQKYISSIDPSTSIANSSYVNTSQLSVMFNNSFNIEQKLKKVLVDTKLDVPIGINWAYASVSLAEDWMNLVPYAAVLFIIMLSGYLLIYNIFYISVVRDVKFYGLLKTIGTTPRQLRKIISVQAQLLYLIALPFGLASGYGIGCLLTPLMNSFSSQSVEASYSVSPIIFIGAAIFSYITVWLGASKPGKIASRISPVEAVRFSGVPIGGKKKSKKSNHGAKLNSMALSNLFRSKKKLILMLSSLSLSITLFSTIFTIISSLDVNKYLSSFISGDFVVFNKPLISHRGERQGDPFKFSEEFSSTLGSIDGVKRIDNVYYKFEPYAIDAAVRAVLEPIAASPNPHPSITETLKGGYIQLSLYGLDSGWFDLIKKDIIEGSFNQQKFESGNYVIVTESLVGEDASVTYYHPGDILKYDGLGKSYEVMAILKTDALYAATTKIYSSFGYNAFLPSSELKKELPKESSPSMILSATLQADSTKLDDVEQAAKAMTGTTDELTLKSREDYRLELAGFITIFQTLGYGLSFVIALIGVLNYINTVLTGVIARRNEFAVLESIGMTKKQLKKMLVYEGVYNVLFTVIITSTAGVLVTYSISKSITENMAFTVFQMSWLPFIMVVPVLLVIAYSVTMRAYRMLTKSTIVERLREIE